MPLELWLNYPCPVCERNNWLFVEHWDDPEIQGVHCWYCDETCWMDIYDCYCSYDKEITLRNTIGIADPKEVLVVNGLPRPRKKKLLETNTQKQKG